MFKLIKRNDKYYQKFSDGEIEITESEFKKLSEGFSEFERELNYLRKEYPSMTIERFNNKVESYEKLKKFYSELQKKILSSIDKKEVSIENAILTLNLLRLEVSAPKNSLSKTSENSDYNIRFIQNIIDKLELYKAPPQQKESEQLKVNSEQIFIEIKSSENQFWKGLPMEQVIKHFEVMTKRKNKSGNVFLATD